MSRPAGVKLDPGTPRRPQPISGRAASRRRSTRRARAGWTTPTLIASGPIRVRLPMSARRAPFVLLVAALLAGGLAALLALNTASAAAELRRHDLAATNTDLAADEQQLTADLAARQAPASLAAAAAKLGMVPNTDPGYVTVGRAGRATVQGSPQPARRLLPPAPSKPKVAPAPAKPKVAAARAHPTSSAALPGGPR